MTRPWMASARSLAVVLFVSWPHLGVALETDSAATPCLDRRTPVTFEENRGQAPADVRFVGRARDAVVWVGSRGITILQERPDGSVTPVKLGFPRSSTRPTVIGTEPLPGRVNRLVGRDPLFWQQQVRTFGRVRYVDLYPGLDLEIRGLGDGLEYDVLVAPGADPSAFEVAFEGARSIRVDDQGDLVLATAAGPLRQRRPVAYQASEAGRRNVPCGYSVRDGHVRLALGAFDPTRELVVDPVLAFSTYLGGMGKDLALGMVTDADGNAYVVGYTDSVDLPIAAALDPTANGERDVFVAKYDAAGAVIFSTYLGGTNADLGFAIALDSLRNIYITGRTSSPDFPVVDALQGVFGGGGRDVFVTKLDPTGTSILYSTFLGGSGVDAGFGLAIGSSGDLFVSGYTDSTDFPTRAPAQPVLAGAVDAFVARLRGDGQDLVYSTYLGGSGAETFITVDGPRLALDAADNAVIAGSTSSPDFPVVHAIQPTYGGGEFDGFVARIQANGAVGYATYLGGTNFDTGLAVAVDSAGSAFVGGGAYSTDFGFEPPGGTPPSAYVVKLRTDGTREYTTRVAYGFVRALAADGAGRMHVTGNTDRNAFPRLVPEPLGGGDEAFYARLSASGDIELGRTFGGAAGEVNPADVGRAIAIGPTGDVYIAGETLTRNFPLVAAAQWSFGGDIDAFVARIVACGDGTLDPGEECDDGNFVASDCCVGCRIAADATPCDDVNECTTGDRCVGGTCTAAALVPDGSSCDDEQPCTIGDRCETGDCAGAYDAEACLEDVLLVQARLLVPHPDGGFSIPLTDVVEGATYTGPSPIPSYFGVPVAKAGETLLDPAAFYTAYSIKYGVTDPRTHHIPRRGLRIVNRLGEQRIDTRGPAMLLARAAVDATTQPDYPPDGFRHYYKCYRVKRTAGSPRLPGGLVVTVDGPLTPPGAFRLGSVREWCVPAWNPPGFTPANPVAQLLCYRARRASPAPLTVPPRRFVTDAINQYPIQLEVRSPAELCVPSLLDP